MSTLGRSKTPSRDEPKKPGVFEKLSGTLSRKKKAPEDEHGNQGGAHHATDEDEVLEVSFAN